MSSVRTAAQEGAPKRAAFLSLLCLPLVLVIALSGCAADAPAEPSPVPPEGQVRAGAAADFGAAPAVAAVDATWQPLRERLAADGLAGPEVDALLATLGPRTQSPMGRKMTELYKSRFLPKPPKKKTPLGAVYKGVVTEANAKLCRDFISLHRADFAAAEKRFGVPPSVAVSLLFVETRLGRYLGDVKENALQTLASMATSTTVASIDQWLDRMPGYEKHGAWFAETMPRRADWAYRETRALVAYMLANGIRPEDLPGSIYGAIGLCQFMPSNIRPYGVDSNGDGRVNLYDAGDAVASLSNYLAKHGWKKASTRTARHRVLMRYNKSTRYANTILALADLVAKGPTGGASK